MQSTRLGEFVSGNSSVSPATLFAVSKSAILKVIRHFPPANLVIFLSSLLSNPFVRPRNEGSKLEEHLQLVSKYENYLKELSAFQHGGKKTEADLKNDLKSYERCLDRSLYLVTKLNVGKAPVWTFPFAVLNKEDESLREVISERDNSIKCDDSIRNLIKKPD